MPNSSPSKLALWMEYSLADLDKKANSYAKEHILSPSGNRYIYRKTSLGFWPSMLGRLN
jgi:hypothetical protein